MNDAVNDVSAKQLAADFKAVVADAEALIKATAHQGDEKLAKVRAQAEHSLETAKARLAELQSSLVMRTEQAAKAGDRYVHENPWQSMGVAAGVGLVVGLLLRRH